MAELRVTARVERGGAVALDVDLALPAGITCVVGPSGAGKSTLLATLAGLERPNQGSIHIGQSAVRPEGRPPAGVGIVLQSYGLLSLLTALSIVALYMVNRSTRGVLRG